MDDFCVSELSGHIKNILDAVRDLNTRMETVENKKQDGIPEVAHAGRATILSPFMSFVVEVTSVNEGSAQFVGEIQMPADSASKWSDDTVVTTPIIIDYPSNVSAPSVGDIVSVEFTGTYGDEEEPRYGYFSSGGSSYVHFELKEPYEAYQDDPVEAYVREWDPEADNGTGAYVTNCSAATVWVKDLSDEGFAGAVGSVGHGTSMVVDNTDYGTVIKIEGLQCLPDTLKTCG
jgi:hypothetical protein